MNRFILLGTAAGLFFAGPASALTMTPTADNRSTSASAMAGFDSNSNSDAPGAGFPNFVSETSANASDIPELTGLLGDVSNGFHGAWASANARQSSQIGSLSISGSGSADASGGHGDLLPDNAANLVGDTLTPVDADFRAYADSVLEILFSIDESAGFDLSGFLNAGTELAVGVPSNDVVNYAGIILINTDTNVSAFTAEISNNVLNVNESGVIGPGNYRFRVQAYAEVFGAQIFNQAGILSDADALPFNGYATHAGFEGVNLNLTPTDQPIPEPVTTTLAAMGLGALVLKTSRRRA